MNNFYKLLVHNSQIIKDAIISRASSYGREQYIYQLEDNLGLTVENISNLFISFSSEECVQQEKLDIIFL